MTALQQEVEILTEIDHPNVVKLFEIYEDDNSFYMVMELMTGGELFQRIVEAEHFSEKQAAETVKAVVDALHYCHELNIAHRDLKPENLLYASKDPGSVIKISDFGLARFINDQTMTTMCGTPGYVAPEIIHGNGYNKAIDYWSLGVILYIMLCGFPPFYSENNDELFEIIVKGKFDFPSPAWDTISKEAKDLIRGLLTTDPSKRWSYEKIKNHLWLNGKNSDKSIPDIQKNIKNFSASKQFKKIKFVLDAAHRLKMSKN
ncbi:hypothetical protein IMG5_148090 [Ichthyophthirius multifiliis]|uniref:Protein kinase domain-containing protein n=1 Tax=Ichthyophthirius multifiliis TaxID=5932 RepID=G0QY86_ICHMU|nr:hypothetical protein IMG5_148090 [Ichthyophthirius multifiliis]EGR29825.1 hypothetical protein IMG5_148090 [Ichthyophthirius multifiliis]|eukprot:XP_004031061.1 hypothetical protein IMG5_148090 [Ichthyophthirius multifiliis]